MSFVVFAGQIAYERVRSRSGVVSAALRASFAAALAALARAAYGLRALALGHPGRGPRGPPLPGPVRPIATGVPAFLVALGLAAVIRRRDA